MPLFRWQICIIEVCFEKHTSGLALIVEAPKHFSWFIQDALRTFPLSRGPNWIWLGNARVVFLKIHSCPTKPKLLSIFGEAFSIRCYGETTMLIYDSMHVSLIEKEPHYWHKYIFKNKFPLRTLSFFWLVTYKKFSMGNWKKKDGEVCQVVMVCVVLEGVYELIFTSFSFFESCWIHVI